MRAAHSLALAGALLALGGVPGEAVAARVALQAAPGACQRNPGEVYERVTALLTARGHTVSIVSGPEIDTAQKLGAWDVVAFGGPNFGCGWDWGAFQAALPAYVNGGGGVVVTGWGAYFLASNTRNETYPGLEAVLPVSKGTGYLGTGTLTVVSGHPITANVTDFAGSDYNNHGGATKSGATVLLRQGTTDSAAAWTQGAGRVVYLGPNYLADWGNYANEPLLDGTRPSATQLFVQAVEWAAGAGRVTLVADPPSLDFGALRVGTPADRTVTLRNNSGGDVLVNALSVSGSEASDFTLAAPPTPFVITAQSSAAVGVKFTPQAAGGRTATLTVSSSAAGANTLTVALSGTGLAPRLAVTPSPLVFPQAYPGTRSTARLTVSNTGSATLAISSLTIGGADAASFNSARATPFDLAPGASETLTLEFQPTAVGTRNAVLAIASDDPLTPQLNVPLEGQALRPPLETSPAALAFGRQLVGGSSAPRKVTLTNGGRSTFAVDAFTVTGSGAAAFEASGLRLPASIAPGATLELQVVFAPKEPGAVEATLSFTTDAPVPAAPVALSGTGVTTLLSVSPGVLDFGNVRLPGASVKRPVQVENHTGAPLQLAVEIGGASPSAFAASAPPATLADGQSTTVDVTFAPTAPGDFSAELVVRAADGSAPPATVRLFGRAVEQPQDAPDAGVTDGGTGPEAEITRSGCGCSGASAPVSQGLWALLAGASLLLRRRLATSSCAAEPRSPAAPQ